MALKLTPVDWTTNGRLQRTTALPNFSAITMLIQFKMAHVPHDWTESIFSWNQGTIDVPGDLIFVGTQLGENFISVWTASGSAEGARIATTAIVEDTWYNLALRGQSGNGGPLDLFISQLGAPLTKYTGTYNGNGNFGGAVTALYIGNSSYTESAEVTVQNIKLYSAILTDQEIQNEVQQFLPERMQNMVGWWPMVESTLAVNYKDLTGTGDFTLSGTNMTASTADSAPLAWGGMVLTMPGYATAAATQYARPTSTISSGAWIPSTGATLYETIDETSPNDADFNSTVSVSTFEVKLSAVSDPLSSVGHYVRYRINGSGGANMTVSLMNGAVTIASWSHTPAPASPTTYEQTLSESEANAITDYADLRIRFATTA